MGMVPIIIQKARFIKGSLKFENLWIRSSLSFFGLNADSIGDGEVFSAEGLCRNMWPFWPDFHQYGKYFKVVFIDYLSLMTDITGQAVSLRKL
jgi:hypothetical protein